MPPVFIENSRLLKKINSVLGSNMEALTLGRWVLCEKKASKILKYHESIHYEQFKETLVIGFLCIYAYDYVKGRLNGMSPRQAYENTRAEREAYKNEKNPEYLQKRKRFNWL